MVFLYITFFKKWKILFFFWKIGGRICRKNVFLTFVTVWRLLLPTIVLILMVFEPLWSKISVSQTKWSLKMGVLEVPVHKNALFLHVRLLKILKSGLVFKLCLYHLTLFLESFFLLLFIKTFTKKRVFWGSFVKFFKI